MASKAGFIFCSVGKDVFAILRGAESQNFVSHSLGYHHTPLVIEGFVILKKKKSAADGYEVEYKFLTERVRPSIERITRKIIECAKNPPDTVWDYIEV